MPEGRIYSKKIKDEVITFYLNGNSTLDCEREFRIPAHTVGTWARREGVARDIKQAMNLPKAKEKSRNSHLREKSPLWKGGHPWLGADGYFHTGDNERMHHTIGESIMGRPLSRSEVVHHFNGNPIDNRHINLIICSQSYHMFLHSKERFQKAKEIMAKIYPEEVG